MAISQIYKELAQQKKEKEDREKANLPKQRDYDREQAEKVEQIRKLEEELGERSVHRMMQRPLCGTGIRLPAFFFH
jgi:hypothetical protein